MTTYRENKPERELLPVKHAIEVISWPTFGISTGTIGEVTLGIFCTSEGNENV